MSKRFIDGSSESLSADVAVVSGEPFTMACWFNADTSPVADCLMSIADKDVTDDQHRLIFDNDNVTASSFDGTLSVATTTTTGGALAWHHAAGVWTSGSSRTAYLDGGGAATNTDTRAVVNIDAIEIGTTADSTPFGYWDGMIAEAAVWDVALSAAEVLMLAAGYSPLFVRPGNLVFYAPLIRGNQELIGGVTLTENGTPTVDVHPRQIYPSRPHIITVPSVAATNIDTLEKRRNIPGVGRPYMRVQHPVATPDQQWRMGVGLAYGGNALDVVAGASRLLLINPPGLDGGFGKGL